jgi:hypothetical protein
MAVGMIGGGVVVVGARLTVSGLVYAGMSQATASASVTGVLGIAGATGIATTTVHAYVNADAGNWDAVLFDGGMLAGGGLVGIAGGGRRSGTDYRTTFMEPVCGGGRLWI